MSKAKKVDLLKTVEILHEHLDEALVNEVYAQQRTMERERSWSLNMLVKFWTEVVLRAPASLTQALQAAAAGSAGWPKVEASPQAFFQRAKNLHFEFFPGVYQFFVESLIKAQPPRYEVQLQGLLKRFPSVLAVDGSKLDAVAHRLKITWRDRHVLLPGTITAFYDIFRSFATHVYFHADAMESEQKRVERVLGNFSAGTLLIGDRLYCSLSYFAQLASVKLYGLTRLKRNIKINVIEVLRCHSSKEGKIEDCLVDAGAGNHPIQLRRITLRSMTGKFKRTLVTNVLDPEMLTAEEALELYKRWWKIERMFYDLKEVLNLNSFYAANTNAAAMQVFASAIVHSAMRVAQGIIATEHRVSAEEISPAKLYTRIAVASMKLAELELAFETIQRANRSVHLTKPRWDKVPGMKCDLHEILVEPRKGRRRKRKFCEARRHSRSLPDVNSRRRS